MKANWSDVERIFHATLGSSPAERVAFLNEACAGDETLRAEVESLLARAGGASGFLNGAAFEAVAALMSDEHGTLIGRQIGVYRVDARLGAGGMGEVYRARDQKLGRDVAIKVLPTAFTSDSERLARFEREARLLATLNHPNIGAIYGFEESDGVRALILELVDGDTLAELLARADRRAKGQEHTGLPLNQALTIASQIADALDAAHEKGIVHRDLKPANIKITRDGAVKVLDFGLAKLTQASDPGLQTPDLSNLPTVTVGHTHEGLILGTAAYMSPEQASGQPVDKRTDIWAFGCVLYELLTGKQTFTGKSVPEILGSIFKAEPDWSLLPATTPREISTLIRRCLQKEAKNRYHSAADIRIAIEDEIGTSLSGSPVAVQSPATANKLRERLAWAAAAIAAVAALTLAFLHFRPAPTAGSVTRFAVMLPSNERLAVSACQNLALSPDGTHMAYVTTEPGGALQLRLRTTDGLETKTVLKINRGGLDSLFFSPDGQWLGFWADRVLKKVPLSGGTPVTLVNENVCGASWGPDDTIVYGTQKGLEVVSASGGPAKLLVSVDASKGERGYFLPEFLPDGKAVLFTVYTGPAGNDAQIVVQSLETGERRTIIQGAGAGRYVSTGYLVYPAAGTLLAVPFDLASLKIQGKASSVLDGVMPNPGAVSVSRAGSLAYIPGPQKESEPTLVWVDRQGQVQPLNAPPRYYADPRLSPDGRRLAVVIHGEGSKGDIWIYDLGRSVLTRLTLDGNKFRPTWSPDGSRIAFASLKEKAFSLSWIAADGSGAEELLLTRQEVPPLPMSWSQDGFWLAYVLNTPKTTKSDIWILPLRGERRPRLFLQTPFYDAAPRFSPDGRWIVYHSDESGQYEVYVRPFPGPGGKIQISKDGGSGPVWPRNGREVFYQNGDKMMAVDVPTRPTLRPGTPRLLFQKWYEDDPGRRNYDVTSDGQRLLMFQPSKQLSAATQINVVLNWVEELKQKVPTGK